MHQGRFALAALALALPLTALGSGPAHAADATKSLKLESSTLTVYGPGATTLPCSQGNTSCGFIGVKADFSGLDSLDRTSLAGLGNNVPGEVKVTRTYGCQSETGERLRTFDVEVKTTEGFFTRRGLGFGVPATGDTLSVSTFAILYDAQPGNCPAGTQPMIYEIKANNAKIRLTSPATETRDFTIPGTGTWTGAVPTPPIT